MMPAMLEILIWVNCASTERVRGKAKKRLLILKRASNSARKSIRNMTDRLMIVSAGPLRPASAHDAETKIKANLTFPT